MVEPLKVKSARDEFELVLGPPDGQGGSFPVRLSGPGISATVHAYEHGYQWAPAFFADLADHWRGWAGEKSWESAEAHIRLSATADRLGHVLLRVALRDLNVSADWRVEASLLIEAGQLGELATSARAAFERDA